MDLTMLSPTLAALTLLDIRERIYCFSFFDYVFFTFTKINGFRLRIRFS